MDEISQEVLKLHKELKAERVSALVRSNLPEFKGLPPEQLKRNKEDFKYDEYVDVYETDEEYFEGLKETFDDYAVKDMDKSAELYAKLEELTDVSTDEKATLMRSKLHGIGGRSSKKRVKKVKDMNQYAGEIKQAYAKMKAQSERDKANKAEQQYNMLRSKFDILELEKMYQYKYIKAFGSNEEYEKECLTQLEYEVQLKKQGILDKLFELNAATENEALQTARLREIQNLRATVNESEASAKKAYEKARKKDVVEFKKHIYTDEFEIMGNGEKEQLLNLYNNELQMEQVRSGNIQDGEKNLIVQEYGKLHYTDFANVMADKNLIIDRHNRDIISKICKKQYPNISEQDMEKYYCLTALMDRNLNFDKNGKLSQKSKSVEKENVSLIAGLLSDKKDIEVMANAFKRYYDELNERLNKEKVNSMEGINLSKDNIKANTIFILNELRCHSLVTAYQNLKNLFGDAFTEQIRTLTVSDDMQDLYKEFEISLANHIKYWETFSKRIQDEGLTVYTEKENVYPDTAAAILQRKAAAKEKKAEERLAKLGWKGEADKSIIKWIGDAEEAKLVIPDSVLKSALEFRRWGKAHSSVSNKMGENLKKFFPELTSANYDRLCMLVFKPVYLNADGKPDTPEDQQNEEYNKHMFERLTSGKEEIKKISYEILQRYLDVQDVDDKMMSDDALLDKKFFDLRQFTTCFSNLKDDGWQLGGLNYALDELRLQNPAKYEMLERKMELYADLNGLSRFEYPKFGYDSQLSISNCSARYIHNMKDQFEGVKSILQEAMPEYDNFCKLSEEEKIEIVQKSHAKKKAAEREKELRESDKKSAKLRAEANEKLVTLNEDLSKARKRKNEERELAVKTEIFKCNNYVYWERFHERQQMLMYYTKYMQTMLKDKDFTSRNDFKTSRKCTDISPFSSDIDRCHLFILLEPVRMDEKGNVVKGDLETDERNKRILRAWLNDDYKQMVTVFEKLFEKLINYRINLESSLTVDKNTDKAYELYDLTMAGGLLDNLLQDQKVIELLSAMGMTDEVIKALKEVTRTTDLIQTSISMQFSDRGLKVDVDGLHIANYFGDEIDESWSGMSIDSAKEAIEADKEALKKGQADNLFIVELKNKILDVNNKDYMTLYNFIQGVKNQNSKIAKEVK